jgi:hypothetical protein
VQLAIGASDGVIFQISVEGEFKLLPRIDPRAIDIVTSVDAMKRPVTPSATR